MKNELKKKKVYIGSKDKNKILEWFTRIKLRVENFIRNLLIKKF